MIFKEKVKVFKKELEKLLKKYELNITTIEEWNGYEDYLIIVDNNDEYNSIKYDDIEE